jgi:hypothetical protein
MKEKAQDMAGDMEEELFCIAAISDKSDRPLKTFQWHM